MLRCKECHIVDVEMTFVVSDNETYTICPNCGAEDSEEEIDEITWEEEMAEDEADRINDYLAIEGDNEDL